MALQQPTSISYPLAIVDGDLALSRGVQCVYDAMRSVIETIPLERAFRPRYGTPDPLFKAVQDPATIAQVYRNALITQIEALRDVSIETDFDEANGVLLLTVTPDINPASGFGVSRDSFQFALR